jgi:hypothetical protein
MELIAMTRVGTPQDSLIVNQQQCSNTAITANSKSRISGPCRRSFRASAPAHPLSPSPLSLTSLPHLGTSRQSLVVSHAEIENSWVNGDVRIP